MNTNAALRKAIYSTAGIVVALAGVFYFLYYIPTMQAL